MALEADKIVQFIKIAIPDAKVTLTDLAGDNNHFAVDVCSSIFEGKTRIEQHKIVYKALGNHMGTTLHALKVTTRTK